MSTDPDDLPTAGGPPYGVPTLAALQAGQYPPEVADGLRRRVADDPAAAAVLRALDTTVDELSLLPTPRMPERYASRLDAALAAAAAELARTAGRRLGPADDAFPAAGFSTAADSSTAAGFSTAADSSTAATPSLAAGPLPAAQPSAGPAAFPGTAVPPGGLPSAGFPGAEHPSAGRPSAGAPSAAFPSAGSAAGGFPPGGPGPADPTVRSLADARSAREGSARAGSARGGSMRNRWLGAAGIAAAVIAIGTVAVHSLTGGGNPTSQAGPSVPAPTSIPGGAPAPGGAGSPTGSASGAPNALQLDLGLLSGAYVLIAGRHPSGTLADPSVYRSCLAANHVPAADVAGATEVAFDGRPAAAIAVQLSATSAKILVVGPTCGIDGASALLATQNVQR